MVETFRSYDRKIGRTGFGSRFTSSTLDRSLSQMESRYSLGSNSLSLSRFRLKDPGHPPRHAAKMSSSIVKDETAPSISLSGLSNNSLKEIVPFDSWDSNKLLGDITNRPIRPVYSKPPDHKSMPLRVFDIFCCAFLMPFDLKNCSVSVIISNHNLRYLPPTGGIGINHPICVDTRNIESFVGCFEKRLKTNSFGFNMVNGVKSRPSILGFVF